MIQLTEREVLIWLSSLGISNLNINKLINKYSDLRILWSLSVKEIKAIKDIREDILDKICHYKNTNYIDELFYKLKMHNINAVTIIDENYPKGLKYIDEAPNVLFAKGEIVDDDSLSIGIVGSRKATAYGKWVCEKFTKELVNMGVTIVSGVALGIDTIAHRTAIESGGRTIGVLGNGIDVVYPKENKYLYNEIGKHGAILTEFTMGTPPVAYNFPQRNRIISGLSLGVIIIEAKEKSGSLITATHALNQGKEVFAVPGNINSIYSKGTNKLIKDGAKPLLDLEDIIEEIYELQLKIIERKKDGIDYYNFSDTEIKIIKVLEEGPAHSDTISYKTGIDISTVGSILTILELKGIIRELSGRTFSIS